MSDRRLRAGGLGWCVLLGLLAAACADVPDDRTPTGALRLFLEAMDRSATDPRALSDAYALLDVGAREALAERARRAEAIGGGREFRPWEMIAQGRHQLAFRPARNGFRETVHGDRAEVIVSGDHDQRATVSLVREGDRWRVVLEIAGDVRGAGQAPGP